MRGGEAKEEAKGEAGFVLLEALMALLLWALVFATMLVAGTMVARRTADLSATGGAVEALDAGLEALRRDVQAALPVRTSNDGGARILFEGAETQMTFVAGGDGVGGHLDERVVTLRAEEGVLTRRFRALSPNEAAPLAPASGEASALIEGPWRFRFSYRAEAAGRRAVARWAGEGALPASVHLDVSTPEGLLVLSADVMPRTDAVLPGEEKEASAEPGRLARLEASDG